MVNAIEVHDSDQSANVKQFTTGTAVEHDSSLELGVFVAALIRIYKYTAY